MLRLLFSSLFLAAMGVGFTQDWQNQGQIDSRDFKVERREGNVVKGTEFVHYEYRVSLKRTPFGNGEWKIWDWCDNKCKGNKHKKHDECDLSCDEKCSEKHEIKLEGRADRLRDNMKEMTKTSASKARALGMPGGPDNWSSATSNALMQIEAAAKADKLSFEAPHINQPCTVTDRRYGLDVEMVSVKGEFWKVGYYQTGGVRTPINEMVDSQEGNVMMVYKTRRAPLDESTEVQCKCKGPIEIPPGEKRTGRIPTFSGLGWRKPDGTVVVPDDKKITVTGTGDGLTKTEIRVNNETGEAYEVIIQAGSKLIPQDGGTQVMTCMGNQTAMIAAAATTVLQVNIHPDPLRKGPTTFTIRVACTEINKRQPTQETKFKIVPPNDPTLARICEIEDTGFMRSAVGQGRVWIYTDAATREQINKHLLPGLTDGMYLNSLHGLSKAGVNLSGPRYKAVLDPALLAASTASKEATFWYAGFLRSMDPKMGYSRKVLDAMKQTLVSKAEAIDARHAAYVALALSESDSKDVRAGVLDLIEKSIPQVHSAEFANEGGLSALLSIATFGDDSEALRVFQIAKLYPGTETKSMLESFGAWGRESIRSAAEEAAKGM